ncbi:MAG: NACHT domain-containing protein [Leptolyngbya sp. SIO3F4]|nr:NACHT domain-containing protein [Leptolyngbya sp. SIO3F4]
MLESAIGGIAVPLFEQVWKAGGYVVGQVGQAQKDVKSVEAILKASQNYQQKYENNHGQVKVMPGLMKEPVPLASIYTAVKFLDECSIRQFVGPNELEQLYRDQGKRRFQTADKRHDGITIAKEKQYLMVLGGPGVGKSTFLRKLGLEAFKGQKGQLKGDQIPVFIELKTFRGGTIDLTTVIANQFEIHGFPDAQAFTELSLTQGKLLILLDGLDEVPTDNVNQVIEHIEDFAIQHDKNTFIASCRTAAYRSSFKQFSDVTIADFDDDQIEQFIQRWFNSDLDQEADTANEYWQLLKQPENKAAKELAQTPLLLTFLCLIYEREQTLPNRRSTLYDRALNILLSEWSAQKRLPKTSIYKDFHPELEKALLSEIAYNSFKEDRLFFSKSDITDRITTFLADILDAPEYLDGPAVLHAIEVQQGILVERATDTYSFSHLTLQEYLTARYIVKNELVSELVSQHLTDQRWREVFLLVMGLMERRGNELLEAIDNQARTDIKTHSKPSALVQWAGRITQGDTPEYEGYEKVAIAIAIASARARAIARTIAIASAIAIASGSARTSASARTRAIASARAIASGSARTIAIGRAINNASARVSVLASARARAIDIDGAINSAIYLSKAKIFSTLAFQELPNQLKILKEKIPQSSASAEQWHSYADELETTYLNALELTAEDISLSREEWNCLSDYLYANELLLRCQRSSIGISRKAWESLKERLLTAD